MSDSKIKLFAIYLASIFVGTFFLIGAFFTSIALGLNDAPDWLLNYLDNSESIQKIEQCQNPTCDSRSDYYAQCCSGELP